MTSPAAPRAANRRATASPMPWVPPVMTAYWPANCLERSVLSVMAYLSCNRDAGRGEELGQMIMAHLGVLERRRLDRVLLGLDDGPAAVADVGEQLRERREIDPAVARYGEDAGQHGVEEAPVLGLRVLEHLEADVLAVDMVDAVGMPLRHPQWIAAGIGDVAGVHEQPDRRTGVGHQQIDLGLGLDDRAHMVVIGHGHAALGHVLGQDGQLGAIVLEIAGGKARPLADGRLLLALHAAGRLGVDHHRRAQLLEGDELLFHALLLLVDGTVEQAAGEPAGDELQLVRFEDGSKLPGIHGELAAGLRAAEAGGAALLETGLERCIAAELRQIVVGPGDRRDAQTDGHAQTPIRCFFLPSAWSAAALRTLSRELTSGTPTSHQASPGVHCEALTLISMT